MNRVNDIIAHDVVKCMNPDGTLPPMWIINIDGVLVLYRPYKLGENLINVGTYFAPNDRDKERYHGDVREYR